MRHLAHCLILLLVPLSAQAAEALNGIDDNGCTYAPSEVERVAAPAASVSLGKSAPVSASKRALPAAGGGSDEEILPRPRAPRWHRLLPGMFR